MSAVALFAAGVYVSVRLLAALYRVRDLWHVIDAAWPGVVRGIVVWGALAALVAWAAGVHRRAFLTGLAGYPVFAVVLYALFAAAMAWKLRSLE